MKEQLILYIYDDDKQKIAELISSKTLGFSTSSNKEIFLFFMALGIDKYVDDDFGKKDTYLRTEYLNNDDLIIIYATAISHFGKADILEDMTTVCDYIQKCAHCGLQYFYQQYKTLDSNKLKIETIKNMLAKVQ